MNPIFVVMRKELREMFRDKRVRNSAFVMPIFIMIMMLFLFSFLGNVLGKASNQKIHVVKTTNPLVEVLKKAKINVIEVPTEAAGEKMIREGSARLLLNINPDKKPGSLVTNVVATYDRKQESAGIALKYLQGTIAEMNDAAVKVVFKEHNIPDELREPFTVKENPLQIGDADTNQMLIGILPYLIVVWAFFGGMTSASDLVAGEKDKNTLETLLIAPIGRSQIALGKFLALCVICSLSSLSSLLGLAIAAGSHLSAFETLFPKGLGIGPVEVGVILIELIPMVALFASVLIAISAYAKNPREAQSYLAIVNLFVIMPAVFSQFIGYTDLASARWISAIPILNTAVGVRQALLGQVDPIGMLITISVSGVLALIAIRIAVELFKREQVLVRV